MNYRELQEVVRQLDGQPVYNATKEELENNPTLPCYNHDNPKFLYRLDNEEFMRDHKPELVEAFERVKKRDYMNKGTQKWHSFVREIFYSDEELLFLRNDLLRLTEMRAKTHKTYFKLKLEKGDVLLPDRINRINKLHISFENFLPIYRNILQNIHFENPIQQNYSQNTNGKINWVKTIQLSKTKFPTYFFTQTWQKQFEHSGNILLILCLKWQLDRANEILHTNFVDEKLEQEEIESLVDIIKKIKKCLTTFPFPDVVNSANKYARLDKNSGKILKLKKNLQIELKQKIIRNPTYQRLLGWIEEFDTLDFAGISIHSSNFTLDKILDIDYTYEAWVFENLYQLFNSKYTMKNSEISRNIGFFEFMYKEKTIIVHHAMPLPKKQEGAGYGHLQEDDPDYTIFVEQTTRKNLFCVLDAKNMKKIERRERLVLLGYTHHLQQDCHLGALISRAKEKKWLDNEKPNDRLWNFCLKFSKESKENNEKTLELIHDEIIAEIDRFLDRKSSE